MKYRPDIDGLRAISVIGVIVYHLDKNLLPGGFLGVDVFFVISGYLISQIISQKLENNSFSIIDFWKSRFSRLYPNLLLMLLICLVAALFLFIEPERKKSIFQSFAAIFSYSNIYLWKTTGGYWHPASENIPVLHTWSLSLEEQFYIFLPLLLISITKLRFSFTNGTILFTLLLFGSLVLCIFLTDIRRSAAFYILPTRMWELLIGVVAARLQNEFRKHIRQASLLALLGVGLIGISFFLIRNDDNFPSYKPIFPCIGAAIVLTFGNNSNIINQILGNKLPIYIGKASYSLYLWHWPAIVFLPFFSLESNKIFICILFIIPAILSYHFIEKPLRHSPKAFHFCGILFFLICIASVLIHNSKFPPFFPEELKDIEQIAKDNRGFEYESTDSILNSGKGIQVGNPTSDIKCLLIGSSHARVYSGEFKNWVEKMGFNGEILATTGIGITSFKSQDYPEAENINQIRSERVKDLNPALTLLAGRWSDEAIKCKNFEKEIDAILKMYSDASDFVFVFEQVPEIYMPRDFHGSLTKYILASYRFRNEFTAPSVETVKKYNYIVARISQKFPNVIFIPTYELLLINENILLKNQKYTYADDDHISEYGAKVIFRQAFLDNCKNIINKINY